MELKVPCGRKEVNNMVSNNMKALRQSKNISMTELSFEARVSERYLYLIEKGEKNPSLKTARKISSALGESIEDIFFTNIGN